MEEVTDQQFKMNIALHIVLPWFVTSCYVIFGFYMVKAMEIAIIT